MSEASNALPHGYALHEYRVESVLGAGGFGMTYLATDTNLRLMVALKEYLPSDYASRGGDNTVQPKTTATTESLQWGLQRFLDEARTLASFRHPSIVRVMRFFEANCTAYMVMEFVEGQPLHEWIAARRPLSRAALLGIAAPLLDGLEVVHEAGFLHRDIKPANIFIRHDGSPVLLDFGSARQLMSGKQEMTAVVSPGYAPFEQCYSHGKQGPWSDLYAFGGVLYWMVTGNRPVEAAARVRQDIMPAAVQAADQRVYGTEVLAAIDWALKPHEDERPQSVPDFRQALFGAGAQSDRIERTARLAEGDAPTIVSERTRAGGDTGLIGVVLDREQVKRVEAELARHIGPIAAVVVRSAVRNAASIGALAASVAGEIGDEKERAAFGRKFAAAEKSGPPTGRTQTGPQQEAPVSQKFSADTLHRAETALAQYIGAIARVVVKRAAAQSRDEAELYLLIADEIKDPAEKKAFIRKAISVSGRR
ncbi:MAG: serine/threonine protein kinase [Betaproteobacteria bacterium]|nr:serine/threonine protein kinase [Betaproteobacteria bacterium]